MTRLYVWRHGRTAWNNERRIQGQADVDLDETGHAQARAAAERLARLRPDAIVSSDLKRAVQTAEYLAAETGLAIKLDARLRERHFGVWQGFTDAELEQRYPGEFDRWRHGDRTVGDELDMETRADLEKRAVAALLDAAEATPGGVTVVTAHGGTAKYGVAALLGWSEDVTRTLGSLANCHWIELVDTPRRGWQVAAYNAG